MRHYFVSCWGSGLTPLQGSRIGTYAWCGSRSLNSEGLGLTLVRGSRIGTYVCMQPEELELWRIGVRGLRIGIYAYMRLEELELWRIKAYTYTRPENWDIRLHVARNVSGGLGLTILRWLRIWILKSQGLFLYEARERLGYMAVRSPKKLESWRSGLTPIWGPRIKTYAYMRPEQLELWRIGAYTCMMPKNRDLRLHVARRSWSLKDRGLYL